MNAIHSHRPVLPPKPDEASGTVESSPTGRWHLYPGASSSDAPPQAGGGDHVPVSAGSLLIGAASFFAVLSAVLVAGPLPWAGALRDWIEPGRFAMGIVYGCAALAFLLAPSVVSAWHAILSPIIAWGERQDWSRREVKRLVVEVSDLVGAAS